MTTEKYASCMVYTRALSYELSFEKQNKKLSRKRMVNY